MTWYPDDVGRWLLSFGWRRSAEEEPFVARTAEVGDETGSAIVAARLTRDVMRQARRHNATGVTEPLSAEISGFHDRPARVLMADRFAQAC